MKKTEEGEEQETKTILEQTRPKSLKIDLQDVHQPTRFPLVCKAAVYTWFMFSKSIKLVL